MTSQAFEGATGSPRGRALRRLAFALIASGAIIGTGIYGLIEVGNGHHMTRAISVQAGPLPADYASDPATSADMAERQALVKGMEQTSAIFHSVSAVTIKRMTWATFATLSGVTGTPWVSSDSYVYVVIQSGDFGWEGDPTSHHPWYLSVISAESPYQPVMATTGLPGSASTPSWWANATDTPAS
jgi:hypothetical protein